MVVPAVPFSLSVGSWGLRCGECISMTYMFYLQRAQRLGDLCSSATSAIAVDLCERHSCKGRGPRTSLCESRSFDDKLQRLVSPRAFIVGTELTICRGAFWTSILALAVLVIVSRIGIRRRKESCFLRYSIQKVGPVSAGERDWCWHRSWPDAQTIGCNRTSNMYGHREMSPSDLPSAPRTLCDWSSKQWLTRADAHKSVV